MSVLNRDLYEALCDLNKQYLVEKNLIINEDESDINLGDDKNEVIQVINALKQNESYKLEACDKIYQNEKNKIKYITLFLSAAVALLGSGLALASLFIVSSIILPVLPVLLLSIAMVGLIKLFLNWKVNEHSANVIHVKSTLDKLNEFDKNSRQEFSGEKILEVQNEIKIIQDKINSLEEKETEVAQNISKILVKLGTFALPSISDPNIDSNEVANRERTPSPAHA